MLALALQDVRLYDVDMELPQDVFDKYLSPFSPHTVEYKGVVYKTLEHAYHCQRYDDEVICIAIRVAPTPQEAWQISQQYKPQQLPDFDKRKVDVMTALCRCKRDQHADVREALINSKPLFIVKRPRSGPPSDGFWDDGVDGSGRNMSGRIWMDLREELK